MTPPLWKVMFAKSLMHRRNPYCYVDELDIRIGWI
jgi:hypothetical protein